MTINIKHAHVSAIADDPSFDIGSNEWNAALATSMATARLLGRTTAGTGAFEEITVGTGLSLAGGALTATGDGAGYIHPNHTGEVTSVSDGATTIANDVVSNAKLANMAANSFKGNNTGSVADPIDLTVAQTKTLLALTKSDVGLGNVDNTSDAGKPVSTAAQPAFNGKQPLDADLTALAGASATNAIYYRSAADTWATVTIGSNMTFSGGTLNSSAGTAYTNEEARTRSVRSCSTAPPWTSPTTMPRRASPVSSRPARSIWQRAGTSPAICRSEISTAARARARARSGAGTARGRRPQVGTPTTRLLTAGAGLTGGGDLSADRTFTVGAGAGITVNADDVALTVPVTAVRGGTGQTVYAQGDIIYADTTTSLAKPSRMPPQRATCRTPAQQQPGVGADQPRQWRDRSTAIIGGRRHDHKR